MKLDPSIHPYQASHHAAGTWGCVGECAQCRHGTRATHEQRRRLRGRVRHVALCARHAKLTPSLTTQNATETP